MEDIYVIVGLGNPGTKYELNRHNIGFLTIDFLAEKYGVKVKKLKHKALFGEGKIRGSKVVFVKPQTFMNSSGESVQEIISWYKADLQNLIIIYDDVDLETGQLRIRATGSAGSHNGMKSIIYMLGSDKFPRIRLGIGQPPQGWDLADYVLGNFRTDERDVIKRLIERTSDAVGDIVNSGIEIAMNRHNGFVANY
jgi:peptidyl-tRNA hydrolase, PTH1 family